MNDENENHKEDWIFLDNNCCKNDDEVKETLNESVLVKNSAIVALDNCHTNGLLDICHHSYQMVVLHSLKKLETVMDHSDYLESNFVHCCYHFHLCILDLSDSFLLDDKCLI